MIIGLIILISISIFLYGLLQNDLSNNEKYEKNNGVDKNKFVTFVEKKDFTFYIEKFLKKDKY